MERLAGRIILLWGWPRALAAFAAGAFAVLTQAPYDFFAAGFFALPLLVWLLDGCTGPGRGGFPAARAAFGVGYAFGFGYFLAGLWWIGSAVLFEADSFAWALPFAVLGIPLLLASFYGLATAVARLLWSDGIGRIAALACGFGLAEWLRTFVLTGFPWNAIGYAAMPVPAAMQSASLIGLTGMNVAAVFVFAVPALLAARRHRIAGMTAAIVLIAAHLGFGAYRLAEPEAPAQTSLAVRIVQPAIDMAQKWDRAAEDRIFQTLIRLSGAPPATGAVKPALIVWPETSVPFLFTDRPDALAAIGTLLGDDQMLLAGAVRGEGGRTEAQGKYYNSVVAIDGEGAIADAVDKVHLVPFGEYLPFEDMLASFGVSQFVAGPMNFQAGSSRHAIALPGGAKAMPFVCYEIIFPDLVAIDAASASLMVNVTNDAWFGNTPGPYQHLRQAQVRAVETGIPLIRAANTGISAVVDRKGRIVDALGLNVEGTIDATVSVREAAGGFESRGLAGLGLVGLAALMAFGFRLRKR